MSYGTRKAIAGTEKGSRIAAEAVSEAVRRYDACGTMADIRDVLAWAKERGGWFWRTAEDDARMREAFNRARERAALAASENR